GGLALTAFGYVGPIVAALLQNVGSLIVIFNSARLVREGEELEPFKVVGEEPGDQGQKPAATAQPAPQPA
ncbi:MAG: hypothetical protein HYZ36_01365, partial [Pedosphaera parvula]|nr:hypothetical protein [Pedosphaera parvula]